MKKNLSLFILALLASCFQFKQSDTQSDAFHITTQANQEFTFALPARYSAGYKWMLTPESFNPAMVQKINDTYEIERNALIGGKGTQTFIFKALKKGDATITLFYKRPWENAIEKTHTITITIE